MLMGAFCEKLDLLDQALATDRYRTTYLQFLRLVLLLAQFLGLVLDGE